MKRTPKYVGLDVHQATTVTAVLEENGRVIARSVVPTEATALVGFCRLYGDPRRLGQSRPLSAASALDDGVRLALRIMGSAAL